MQFLIRYATTILFVYMSASFIFACGRTNAFDRELLGGTPPQPSSDDDSDWNLGGQGGNISAGSPDIGEGGRSFGVGVRCEVDADCNDSDLCTHDICNYGRCRYELIDQDSDGHTGIVCGGNDCNDLNPNVFSGHPEVCSDGSDNDCNGVSDCFDPACEGILDCGCRPSLFGENCNNGQDDDCDQKVDCSDLDCIGSRDCECSLDEINRCLDGLDNDCDGAFDCADLDCRDSQQCICHAQDENCENEMDDDCDLLIDCADFDCMDTSVCMCLPPGSDELCNDNFDNDCDRLIDCADPDCLISEFCRTCSREICDDGIDNNCNNYIDCSDVSCFFSEYCIPVPEICSNYLDDDNDLLIDCSDSDCASSPICLNKQSTCLSPRYIAETGSYIGSTIDNINGTRGSCGGDAGEAIFYFVLTESSYVHIDSIGSNFDSALYVRKGSCELGAEIGCDDDSGGSAWAAAIDFPILFPGTYYVFLDGFAVDPIFGKDEGSFQLNIEIQKNPQEICSDSIDNDGDQYKDCADEDCYNDPSCFMCNKGKPPSAEFGVGACTDGKDNDCDGLIDCNDDDCSASDYYTTECCNGFDQNDNGIPDDFNCRCKDDTDCIPSQICYTHSTFTCGLPCHTIVGDICPSVIKGSYCNSYTSQCEF